MNYVDVLRLTLATLSTVTKGIATVQEINAFLVNLNGRDPTDWELAALRKKNRDVLEDMKKAIDEMEE